MAATKTSSTHRSAFVQATHRLDILGYSTLKSLGVRTSIRSGTFHAGGFPWALVCCVDEIEKPAGTALASISLELSKNETHHDVVAMASLRIDEAAGTGQFPAAVWRSEEANTFRPRYDGSAVAWELSIPDAFRDHEARYVDADQDRVTIHCTVDVLRQDTAVARDTRDCVVSSLPPPRPSIARDFHKLLRGRCMPDVTFVVEGGTTEIPAHRLVLAMRSPVFRAQFFFTGGDMMNSTRRLVIDDMSASTLRAMLYFIYTDEQPRPKRGACPVAMAQDLLVAADLYALDRLRLMCEKTLSENIEVDNVMTTLTQVHGRHSCRQLEASCIDFLASNREIYEAVEATEEYQELDKHCAAFINDVTKKVARNSLSSTSTSTSLRPHKSMSRYNPSTVFRGTHEFMIGNLRAARQRRHVDEEYIRSGAFQFGGYRWAIDVHLWMKEEEDNKQEHIGLFLVLLNAPEDGAPVNLKPTAFFRIGDPSGGKSPATQHELGPYTSVGEKHGVPQFITLESATSLVEYDGSLTINGDFHMATLSCTSTANANAGAKITVPPTDLAWHLEQLLASQQGSDVKFLVQETVVHAHSLVIAARSPVLHRAVVLESATTDAPHHVRIDNISVIGFKAMLHFIYTDELPLIHNLDISAGDFTTVAGDMLAAACQFRLERMKRLSINLLAEKVTTVSDALATVKVARRHSCPELEEYCKQYMSLPHVSNKVRETCISLFLKSQLA